MNLLKDNITVSMPMEMTLDEIRANNADINQAVFDEVSGKYCFYDLTFTIDNSITFDMPITGGNQTVMYIVLIAGLAAVVPDSSCRMRSDPQLLVKGCISSPVLDYRDSSRIHIPLLSDSKTILNKMQVYLFSFLFVLSFYHTLFCHTLFTAALYHKSTVLSESLQYLHSYKQTFSLFLQVHMLHPGSNTHKMHVEICLSSAKTDIL